MSGLPTIIPISDLRQDTAGVIKRAALSHEPVFITQRGRPAALRDEYRLVRECRTFDDARCVLAQIRDGDDGGQSTHVWYLLEYRLWYHQWELRGGAHSIGP